MVYSGEVFEHFTLKLSYKNVVTSRKACIASAVNRHILYQQAEVPLHFLFSSLFIKLT